MGGVIDKIYNYVMYEPYPDGRDFFTVNDIADRTGLDAQTIRGKMGVLVRQKYIAVEMVRPKTISWGTAERHYRRVD